jgi:hypothetical protein
LIGNCAGAMLRCTPKITSKALQNKVLYKYFLKGYSLLTLVIPNKNCSFGITIRQKSGG